MYNIITQFVIASLLFTPLNIGSEEVLSASAETGVENEQVSEATVDPDDQTAATLTLQAADVLGENYDFSQGLSDVFGPVKNNPESLGIEITAPRAVVVDASSGKVLFAKDHNSPAPIASITKLVTALSVLEHHDNLQAVVKIEPSDERSGNITRLLVGDEVTIEQLLNLSLVASVNEAAVALTRATGQSETDFVRQMNDLVTGWGLSKTFFVDPTGLGLVNFSTANEASVILSRALENETIKDILQKPRYTFTVSNTGRTQTVYSTNQLFNSFVNDIEQGYIMQGGKTGFIEESRYCLVFQTEQDGHVINVVLLGSTTNENRWQEAKGLAYWTFENYNWR